MWRDKIPSRKAARFALHTGVLFVVLVAIHVAVGRYPVFPLDFFACAAYLFIPFILHRELRKKPVSPDRKSRKLLSAGMVSGAAAALALNASLPLLWLSKAYRWDEYGDASGEFLSAAAEVISGDYSYKVAGMVVLLLLSALLLGLALAYRPEVQRAEHNGSTTQFRGLSAASILSFWLWGFVFVAILELLYVLSKSARQYLYLLDELIWDRVATIWDLFLFYPAVPGGILVTAAMVVVFRDVTYQFDLPSDGPAVSPEGRVEGTPVKLVGLRAPGFAAAAVAGLIAVVGIYTYYVHFGIVASVSAHALTTSAQSRKALDRWIGEQREAGQSDAEIAAAVNAGGHWSPDTPAKGLASLLPAPGETPADVVDGWACPVTVAAGIVAVAELAAAPWPDMSALPPHVTRRNQRRRAPEDTPMGDAEELAAEFTPPAVRYCIRVTCPSPVAWQAPDAISLGTSHASASPDWMYPVYFDLYADGVAASPGGYCTADGELAAEYQG